MYQTKRMILYGGYVVGGLVLVVLACMEQIPSFWSGFGGGIAAIGVLRLILGLRYQHDEQYAKSVQIKQKDERMLYLSAKAKSWTFYIAILTFGVLCILFQILGNHALCVLFAWIECGMMLCFWVVYLILNRKY